MIETSRGWRPSETGERGRRKEISGRRAALVKLGAVGRLRDVTLPPRFMIIIIISGMKTTSSVICYRTIIYADPEPT